jgi:hypothetical protein
MIEFAPYMKDNLLMYDKYVDNNGRTTLNLVEYAAYRKQIAEKTKAKNKV